MYYINNLFQNVNDASSAYWLGFLFADGFVSKDRNRVRLELQIRDEYMIDNFLKFLDTNYKKYYTKNNSVGVQIDNEILHSNLIKLGCIPLKSYTNTSIPSNILNNEILLWNFLRGIFDGDGCIFKEPKNNYGIYFMGTKNIIEQIQKCNPIFSEFFVQQELRSNNCYYLRTSKFYVVKEVFNKMYNNIPTELCLKRKYDIFKNYISERSDRKSYKEIEYDNIFFKYCELKKQNEDFTKKKICEILNISRNKLYNILKYKNVL